MKLLTLLIKHFRGIIHVEINAQGKNVNIYGQNGACKTTAEDGFLWLLFDKDSADKKDYDLIPHIEGTTEPDVGQGKEPSVEATLEYFGKTVKLKKTYIEEWPKRGEFKGTYTGSKKHFYVDDLEVKAGEYQQIVSELVDSKLFKLITNPAYFSSVLSWQERRNTLVDIGGDLNIEMPEELTKSLDSRTFDKYFALAKQNVKTTQKELDGLPFSISEAKRLIVADLPIMPDIEILMSDKALLEEQMLAAKSNDAANAQRRAIADIETEIVEARNKYNADIDAKNTKIERGIYTLEAEKRVGQQLAMTIKGERDTISDNGLRATAKKASLLAEWHEADDRVWTGSSDCPTCGQALPPDEIETAKANFNRQRSEDLERLKSEGMELKADIERKTEAADNMRAEITSINAEIDVLAARIEKGRAMLVVGEFTSTDECKVLQAKLKAASEAPADNERVEKIQYIQYAINDAQHLIDEARAIKQKHTNNTDQQKRVDELMAREKDINATLGNWEKAVHICEQHVKAMAKALEMAVNGKFKIARFRLFATQKNGEEAECCDVVYPNGSTNLSTGERLQTGIDIINTLTEYYGVDAPIWIDNAEGVTLQVESKSQLMKLFASKADEKLRIEVEA